MALMMVINKILRCTKKINQTYPALSFSFTSVMPSLETSLLKTRIPMTMFTYLHKKRRNEAL